MKAVEAAILRTLLYADLFQFAMTTAEVHYYLIHDEAISLATVQRTLDQSEPLNALLHRSGDYIALKEHADFITLRENRERITDPLWADAIRYGKLLAQIPFVRMVALTGALAMRNPKDEHDDYDYLLITQTGRVWLARIFAIVCVRLMRLRGKELCPNYVLADNRLVQDRQDLFIAHEITQMMPIFGQQTYDQMRQANRWTDQFLPNAYANDHHTALTETRDSRLKHLLERLLSGRFGDWIENWEFRRKSRKFAIENTYLHSDAKIDSDHVKGHFNDYGYPILQRYQERLREYDLIDDLMPVAGD